MSNKQVTKEFVWAVFQDCPPLGERDDHRSSYIDRIFETEAQAVNYASTKAPAFTGYRYHVAKIIATYEVVISKSLKLTTYGKTNGDVSTMC